MVEELNKQAFALDLMTKIDVEKLSKEADYLAPPKKINMFMSTDATFDSTLIRIFENGWIRVYVVTEAGSYGEAMFKATESLTYLRRIITDVNIVLGEKIDADKVLAGIKPISEELAMYELLLLDLDSVRPKYKRDAGATYFRMLHHSTLEKYLGVTTAVKILYSTGEEAGRIFSGIYSAKTLDSFLKGLKEFMDSEKIADISILSADDSVIRIKSSESMTSAGIPAVARPVCHFERGFITGAVSSYLGKKVTSQETRCWGLGDTFCEFVLTIGG
jgi:predicted hydrocarbon binding protein